MIAGFAVLSDPEEKLARKAEIHGCVGIPLAAYTVILD